MARALFRHRAPLCFGLVLAAGAGWVSAEDVAPVMPLQTYLMDLHLHSTLSEGYGTMRAHVEQAQASGYDGLLFSEHLGRNVDFFGWPVRFGFEGKLHSEPLPPPISLPLVGFRPSSTPGAALQLSYERKDPAQGRCALSMKVGGVAGTGTRSGRLGLDFYAASHRAGLLAEPRIAFRARLPQLRGSAGALFRATLSGQPDGVSKEGVVNIIEYVPADVTAPPAAPGVLRVSLPPLGGSSWKGIQIFPADDAVGAFVNDLDSVLLDFEFEVFSDGFGEVELQLDDFRYGRRTGRALFHEQHKYLQRHHAGALFHHVGMEIGGPLVQELMYILHTRDHLIAMMPAPLLEVPHFPEGTPQANAYPNSGVDWVRARGGVTILAHIFGPRSAERGLLHGGTAQQLAARVIENRAFGADAIEVGYRRRGRDLEEFVRVWDLLSADQVYITGVGSGDNHSMQPWRDRTNRMGSWLLAPSAAAGDLVTAVRGGEVFFGDPFVLDPDGLFVLSAADGSYRMGDVVPLADDRQEVLLRVEGARPGDRMVLLHNGAAVASATLSDDGDLDLRRTFAAAPGDWVRAELHDSQGRAYAFTNPVYFIEPGEVPPPHRAP